uniref:Uncharacterized protein n=1 Tax=Timema genevievae TaxID=629358 RepID=A0A7R9K388_TIMGE|nr:unnamed protein product [Timema genevievae]
MPPKRKANVWAGQRLSGPLLEHDLKEDQGGEKSRFLRLILELEHDLKEDQGSGKSSYPREREQENKSGGLMEHELAKCGLSWPRGLVVIVLELSRDQMSALLSFYSERKAKLAQLTMDNAAETSDGQWQCCQMKVTVKMEVTVTTPVRQVATVATLTDKYQVNLCGLGVKGTPQDPMFVGSSKASKILTGLGSWSYDKAFFNLLGTRLGGVGVTRDAPACQSSLNYSSLWKLEMMTVRVYTHHFKYFLRHVGGHAHTLAFFLLPFLLYFSLCAPS